MLLRQCTRQLLNRILGAILILDIVIQASPVAVGADPRQSPVQPNVARS